MLPLIEQPHAQWFEMVLEAEKNLKGHAHCTPILTSRTLNQMVGAEVFCKCENFQRIGAFKFRGAYHAIYRLSDKEKQAGVITFSSGNHAQAVALVGQLLNIKTLVVMPDDAPSTKRAATQGYGATVVGYDPDITTREEVARKLAAEHGCT
ncbi:MAG: pyridoxal-phosphate dependent enzyme, partial [Desulfatirhabdiaceae bacterium]